MKNIKALIQSIIILILLVYSSCTDDPRQFFQDEDLSSPFTKTKTKGDQIGNHILEIFEDSHGNIWIGTVDKGVARFNNGSNTAGIEEEVLTYFTEKDGLCGKTVADIAEDEDGVLWFGTYSDMCRLEVQTADRKTSAFLPFEKNQSIPKLGWGWKNVRTDRNGDLWVNTHHGIFRYLNEEFIEFEVPTSNKNQPSFCNTPGKVAMYIVDSKGGIWFGTDGDGAYRYDPVAEKEGGQAFTHFTKEEGLSSNNVSNIIEDVEGNIWFACVQSLDNGLGDGGLCRYDNNQEFTSFGDLDGLHGNNIHTLYEDKSGNIWIGATGVGLYRYEVSSHYPLESSEKFTLYREPSGVILDPTGYTTGLQSILEDSKGRLWCGFSGGLFRLENHQNRKESKGATFVNVTKDGPWD